MSGLYYKGKIRQSIAGAGLMMLFIFFGFINSNAQDIYAIDNGGDWDDGTTWSLTSGGGACSCEPDANSLVHIGERVGVTMKVIIRDDKDATDTTKDMLER